MPDPPAQPPAQTPKSGPDLAKVLLLIAVPCVLIYAMMGRQQVNTVDAPGFKVTFFQKVEALPPAQKQQNQQTLQTKITDLRAAHPQSDAQTDASPFTGEWQGGDGIMYNISQSGTYAIVKGYNPSIGIVTVGAGQVINGTASISYQNIFNASGIASLTISPTAAISMAISVTMRQVGNCPSPFSAWPSHSISRLVHSAAPETNAPTMQNILHLLIYTLPRRKPYCEKPD